MLFHRQALNGALCIQAFTEDGEERFRRVYLETFGGPVRFLSTLVPANAFELRAALVLRADRTLDVFWGGINGDRQGREVAFGYADIEQPGNEVPANSFFLRLARDVANSVATLTGANENPRWRFWGHSSGGATAEVSARMVARAGGRVESVCTYGAPKAGFAGACLERPGLHRNRYMAWGDPVPLVPHGDLPARGFDRACLSVLMSNARPWLCIHGSGGILLTGREDRPAGDAQGDNAPAVALQQWVEGNPLVAQAHGIVAYVSLLRSATFRQERFLARQPVMPRPEREVMNFDRQVEGNVVLEGFDVAPPTTPGINYVIPIEISPLVASSQPMVVYVGGRGLTTIGGILFATATGVNAMAQSKLRGRLMMTRVRIGTGWGIVWNDFLIASFATPSSARTFAKAGNRFLRLMGNRGTIYTPIFWEAFASFIAAASAGDPDYQPPLQTAG